MEKLAEADPCAGRVLLLNSKARLQHSCLGQNINQSSTPGFTRLRCYFDITLHLAVSRYLAEEGVLSSAPAFNGPPLFYFFLRLP